MLKNVSYIMLDFLDILSTATGLAMGKVEANPIASWLISNYGIGSLFIYSQAVYLGTMLVACFLASKVKARWFPTLIFILAFSVKFLAVANNIQVLGGDSNGLGSM
jgi:hypothetical protein